MACLVLTRIGSVVMGILFCFSIRVTRPEEAKLLYESMLTYHHQLDP